MNEKQSIFLFLKESIKNIFTKEFLIINTLNFLVVILNFAFNIYFLKTLKLTLPNIKSFAGGTFLLISFLTPFVFLFLQNFIFICYLALSLERKSLKDIFNISSQKFFLNLLLIITNSIFVIGSIILFLILSGAIFYLFSILKISKFVIYPNIILGIIIFLPLALTVIFSFFFLISSNKKIFESIALSFSLVKNKFLPIIKFFLVFFIFFFIFQYFLSLLIFGSKFSVSDIYKQSFYKILIFNLLNSYIFFPLSLSYMGLVFKSFKEFSAGFENYLRVLRILFLVIIALAVVASFLFQKYLTPYFKGI